MRIVFATAAVLTGLAMASAASAMTVVEVEAGQTCSIMTDGDFTCIWTAEDGSKSSAKGNASMNENAKTRYAMIALATFEPIAKAGRIEFELPFTAWEGSENDRIRSRGYVYGTIKTNAPPISGFFRLYGSFSNTTVSTGSSAKLRGDGYFSDEDFRFWGGRVNSGGIWSGVMEWSFDQADVTSQYTRASSGFDAVPEPAAWAMMITGFGLIGAALRRRPSAIIAVQ